MLVIGLTGGIASGKSTISSLLKDKGAAIIDADKIAREILMPGMTAWVQTVKHFGEGILKNKREIDREKLARIVFSDKKQLAYLNSFTHPEILKEIKKQLRCYKKIGEKITVLDAALLLELNLNSIVDEVWVISVDEKNQLKRLLAREKGLNKKQAVDRIKSQMPLNEKLKFAHRVIDNNGNLEQTRLQVDKIWKEIS